MTNRLIEFLLAVETNFENALEKGKSMSIKVILGLSAAGMTYGNFQEYPQVIEVSFLSGLILVGFFAVLYDAEFGLVHILRELS